MTSLQSRVERLEERAVANVEPWPWGTVSVECYRDDSDDYVQELLNEQWVAKYGSIPPGPRPDGGISSVVVVIPYDRSSPEAQERERKLAEESQRD